MTKSNADKNVCLAYLELALTLAYIPVHPHKSQGWQFLRNVISQALLRRPTLSPGKPRATRSPELRTDRRATSLPVRLPLYGKSYARSDKAVSCAQGDVNQHLVALP